MKEKYCVICLWGRGAAGWPQKSPHPVMDLLPHQEVSLFLSPPWTYTGLMTCFSHRMRQQWHWARSGPLSSEAPQLLPSWRENCHTAGERVSTPGGRAATDSDIQPDSPVNWTWTHPCPTESQAITWLLLQVTMFWDAWWYSKSNWKTGLVLKSQWLVDSLHPVISQKSAFSTDIRGLIFCTCGEAT